MNMIVNKRKKCKYPSLHIQQLTLGFSWKCFIPTFDPWAPPFGFFPVGFVVTLALRKSLTVHSSFWRCQREVEITLLKLFLSIRPLPSLNKQTNKQANNLNNTVIHDVKPLSTLYIVHMLFHRPVILPLASTTSPAISSQFRVRHFA